MALNHFADVQQLVREHNERIPETPIALAVYYDPRDSQPDDVWLLEVLNNFGRNEVSLYKELYETGYTLKSGFPLPPNGILHLILTNPVELRQALHEHWPSVQPFVEAVQSNRFMQVFCDVTGSELINEIQLSSTPV